MGPETAASCMALTNSALDGRYYPADDHPVEAVHDGAEIDLAGRYPKLGDISGPQRVKRIGVEVSLYQVFGASGISLL